MVRDSSLVRLLCRGRRLISLRGGESMEAVKVDRNFTWRFEPRWGKNRKINKNNSVF